ncbi:hypothetical protein BDN72DRAFT_59496 [Pluteus cervinus]|uniref:Uncharacterized protein n=1 Tax=Pluteus cervinus TaxID=181527 RepID=A0ACD3AQZ8_9AGAR|nr:hypothetical protein BDN72DRAFT_59496 [Pluteus cervinus]
MLTLSTIPASRATMIKAPPSGRSNIELLDLPHELVAHIFEALEDYELYRCSSLCRTLNQLSLNVLFMRYPFDVDILNGVIDLRLYAGKRSSPVVLPSLHRAVYLGPMPKIMVHLISASRPSPMTTLKILKDIVVRGRCNDVLWIDLRLMAAPQAYQPITQSLRDLVEAALHNGCEDLKITAGSGLESLLFPPCPIPPNSSYADQKKNLPPSKRLRRYLGQFFTKKRELTETGTISSLEEPPSPSPSIGSHGTYFPDAVYGVRDIRYPNAMNKGCVELSADFFTPTWLDWTLTIINHTTLVRLTIQPTTSSRVHYHMWYDVLPKISAPCLQWFYFSGAGLTVRDFAWFLVRHKATLKHLRLHFYVAYDAQLGYPAPGRNGCVKPGPSHLNPPPCSPLPLLPATGTPKIHLPSLRSLSLSPPLSIPSFLELLEAPYLPKLVSVEIVPYLDKFQSETDLDEAILSLGRFTSQRSTYIIPASKAESIRSETSANERKQPWFSQLVITNIVSLSWIKSHSTTSTFNPFSSLSTIERLNINTNKLLSTSEIITVLPQFLSNLSRLKWFGRLWMDVEEAKNLERVYWEEVRRCCPGLETVQFQFGLVTVLNFQMVDLVGGTVAWPE